MIIYEDGGVTFHCDSLYGNDGVYVKAFLDTAIIYFIERDGMLILNGKADNIQHEVIDGIDYI